ncbi:MAG: ferritin-like domain-containing protein, partial [Bradymonadaceae bacterium]
ATEMIKNTKEGAVRDASMLAAAQTVEHYEISRYGTLRTYAERLKLHEDIDELESNLDEEKETDKKLTEIAEHSINPKAAAGG